MAHLVLRVLVVLLAVTLAAAAQPGAKVSRIGFLSSTSFETSRAGVEEFRAGLRELGHIEGKSVVVEYRWSDGRQDRLPELAGELVRLNVDVIVALVSPAARAAHQATRTIPIVIIAVGDPIGLGLAASLARPGGNVTGLASYGPEIMPKMLQLLTQAVPDMRRLAVFWNPANPLHPRVLKDLEGPARSLAVQVHALRVAGPDDFEAAFRSAVGERAAAVWVFGDPMFNIHRARLAALALSARLPAMHFARAHVEAGALLSYAPNWLDQYRQAATYVDKILKGARPGDLPIEQPAKFELVINAKTARTLGLALPPAVLLQAHEIIE